MKHVSDQFGVFFDKDNHFLMNNEGKVYMVNKDVSLINFEDFFIDKIGLYIGKFQSDGFRPSIEGSQLLKDATKNVVLLDNDAKRSWMLGMDIDIVHSDNIVLVRHEGDFLGSGKVKNNKLLTGIPKARRLNEVND